MDAGSPLAADSVLAFHAARLLILILECGSKGRLDGLTKLAKLDFFIRYPAFFARACEHLQKSPPPMIEGLESAMVRHHYGPWDHRYYHVLAFLEGTRLTTVARTTPSTYSFSLTAEGTALARHLSESPEYEPLVAQLRHAKKVFRNRTGDSLKTLIYDLFSKEIAKLPKGMEIRR